MLSPEPHQTFHTPTAGSRREGKRKEQGNQRGALPQLPPFRFSPAPSTGKANTAEANERSLTGSGSGPVQAVSGAEKTLN